MQECASAQSLQETQRRTTPGSKTGLPARRARVGKIARLPAALREQLNRRIHNGEKGRRLIEWLNALPEVQAVLAADFQGQSISEVNFAAWRAGGYRTWERDQERREGLALLAEQVRGLHDGAEDDVAEQMAQFLTASLVLELQRLDALPPSPAKAKCWRELIQSVVLLRRGNLQGQRLAVEREKLEFRRELEQKEIEEKFWEWSAREENREKILQRLLTPEQNNEEIERKNLEKQRKICQILGIPYTLIGDSYRNHPVESGSAPVPDAPADPRASDSPIIRPDPAPASATEVEEPPLERPSPGADVFGGTPKTAAETTEFPPSHSLVGFANVIPLLY
jgi:hypothetical protein